MRNRGGFWTIAYVLVALVAGWLGGLWSSSPAPSSARGIFDWKPVGNVVMIDVPASTSVLDLNPFRPGKQTFVLALHNEETGRLRISTLLGRVLAEGPNGGFTPRDSLWAGWRIFVWGKDSSIGARLWTPQFNAGLALTSADPNLTCRTIADAATPLAGPFSISIPPGARPGGMNVPSPTQAFVFGNPAGGVRIETAAGITLGQNGSGNVARGGFELADAVFAFGERQGAPALWTPEQRDRSTDLVRSGFVPCKSAAPQAGVITATKRLVPEADAGRFDLKIDGVAQAAGAGDGGTTGPESVSAGDHSVSEAAAAGTVLDDYTSEIACTEDTNPASPVSVNGAGPLTVPVADGDDWRCTITNTRQDDFDGNATVTTNDALRTSATIGSEGGSLSAAGMTLVIPSGALLEPVEITMTPIASMSGTPIDDSLIAGALFGPDGLEFLVPAILTLPLPAGVSAAEVIGFAADGTGTNMHLIPNFVAGQSITLQLAHFSAGGASSGGASAAAAMGSYTPSTTQQQAEQAIAFLIARLANLGIVIQPNDLEVTLILRIWYLDSVKPRLQAAKGTGQLAFEGAASEWQAWEGRVQQYAPDVLVSERTEAGSLATDAAVELAGALLGRCTGFVDYRPPLRDVDRFGATAEFLGINLDGKLYQGRALPAGSQLPNACMHVVIEAVNHTAAWAVNRGNAFAVNAGVAFWNGPLNHSLALTFRLGDATVGPASAVAAETIATGQWQISVRPKEKGTRLYDLTVELADAASDDSLQALSDGQAFNLPVRDRVELDALGPVDLRFGDSVQLLVRVAGDGMEGAQGTYQVQGVGSLSQNSGLTDVTGTAPQFTFAAGTTAGNASVTAFFGNDNDSVAITVKPPVQVTVSPSNASLFAGDQRQFSATVLNATNTSVTWTASGGTINQTGLYTAGSTPGSFIVRATSTEDPAKSATANIEIAANFGRVTLHWVDGQGNSEDMAVITTSPIRPSGVSFPQYEGSAIVESYRLHLENVANGQCSGNFGPETTTVTSPTSAIIWVTTPGNGIYEMLIRFFVATRVECTGQTEVVHTAAVCRIGLAVRDASGQITGLDFGAPLSPDMADPNCTASGVVRFEPG